MRSRAAPSAFAPVRITPTARWPKAFAALVSVTSMDGLL
jgi:hypothetical protein